MKFVIALLLAAATSATAQVTHEEAVVRQAYAKLAYAAKLNVLVYNAEFTHWYPDELQKRLNNSLTFQLSNFKVGDLSDIADERWDTLVTKPQGDVVTVVVVETPFSIQTSDGTMKTRMTSASANWNPWNFPWDWNIPVRQVVAETEKPVGTVYARYAAYTVTVTLDGRSRIYLAMFWYGTDANGKEAIYPVDHIVGMGTLTTFMESSIYPQPLLETYLRDQSDVAKWIQGAGTESCTTDKPDVCCDESGKCGIPRKYLEKSLKIPDKASWKEDLRPRSSLAPKTAPKGTNGSS